MIKIDCPSYPCHKGLKDCTFCYCPLYPCKDQALGEWIVGSKWEKIWDCSKCTKFHEDNAVQIMAEHMKNFNE